MSNPFGSTQKLLLAVGLVFSQILMAADNIPLYTYNTPPPFYPDDPGNLSSYLANFFSEASPDKKFEAVYLPRKRLDNLITNSTWDGAIVWANPIWFNDPERHNYLWSNPIATDYNLVLSQKKLALEYEGPDSLSGLKLGGILGHVYVEFEDMIKRGNLIRENTHSYQSNLLKLKAGRVDVIFIPASSLSLLLASDPEMSHWLHIAKRPRSKFQYFLFCDNSNHELVAFINTQLKRLQSDPKWLAKIQRWEKPMN
ncbi:MAG: ABC transporter substrate-binding protein [Pseudomonadales bacterium]|nr:ABC transporter substrate-binding protein [Pseudomonadales bacterium]